MEVKGLLYDHHPHDQMSLLDAMNAGCLDMGWIRHARRFFPRCIALDDIRCDVDENLWLRKIGIPICICISGWCVYKIWILELVKNKKDYTTY